MLSETVLQLDLVFWTCVSIGAMIAFNHPSAWRLACSKARRTWMATSSKNLCVRCAFSCPHELEHRVQVRVAPRLQAVDFLLVAQQGKAGRAAELQAVLDRELAIDRFHHPVDFVDLAFRFGQQRSRVVAKKFAIASDNCFENVASCMASRVVWVSVRRLSRPRWPNSLLVSEKMLRTA